MYKVIYVSCSIVFGALIVSAAGTGLVAYTFSGLIRFLEVLSLFVGMHMINFGFKRIEK